MGVRYGIAETSRRSTGTGSPGGWGEVFVFQGPGCREPVRGGRRLGRPAVPRCMRVSSLLLHYTEVRPHLERRFSAFPIPVGQSHLQGAGNRLGSVPAFPVVWAVVDEGNRNDQDLFGFRRVDDGVKERRLGSSNGYWARRL